MGLFKNLAACAAVCLLATPMNAHMVMRTPVPYGKSTLNNSPLDPSGSDFPCKQRAGVYDAEGAQNIMAIGEPQTLSFTGSAVHGGGSCQVALTTDLQPTSNSKWMVIKSIEGGCPANVAGNLPADPNGTGASTFQYTIPNGIAPGEYTLAWTWFNKIGNREMYMNCAPATVVAQKRKRYPAMISKRQTSFPDLFIANVGAELGGCTTQEGFDYEFPNPGADVQKAGSGPYTTLSCAANSGNTPAEVPTQQQSSVPTPPQQTSAGAPPQQQPSAPAKPTSTNGNPAPSFAYGGGPNPNGNQPQPTSASSPGIFVPANPDTQAAPTTTSSSGSCTAGFWNCDASGTSFSRCVSGGTWSVNMQMPAGLRCAPGISADIQMSPA